MAQPAEEDIIHLVNGEVGMMHQANLPQSAIVWPSIIQMKCGIGAWRIGVAIFLAWEPMRTNEHCCVTTRCSQRLRLAKRFAGDAVGVYDRPHLLPL